jgi:hypothetical protein
MLSSPVVDVAVGMSFIFALFSVLISKVNETITSFLGARHTGLEKALAAMLGRAQDGDISVQKVLNHPLVRTQTAAVANGTGLVQTGKRKSKGVSYLSARTFSAALLDLLKIVAPQGGSDADPMAKALETVKAMNSECPGHAVLVNLLEAAEGDRDRLRRGLEDWYDDTMDRVSGWYKRYVQRIVLVLSVALVLVVNLDAVNVAENLWQVPAERAAVAQAAATNHADATTKSVDADVRGIASLHLPLGWHVGSSAPNDPRDLPSGLGWLLKLLGLALSVVALSFGAPFWFDALSNIAQVRQSGPKPAQ